MPYCKVCGNTRLFGTSKVPPAAPTANGPISGLTADFGPAGNITSITRLGAEKSTVRAATAKPSDYFDVCLRCGSQEIGWDGAGEKNDQRGKAQPEIEN